MRRKYNINAYLLEHLKFDRFSDKKFIPIFYECGLGLSKRRTSGGNSGLSRQSKTADYVKKVIIWWTYLAD